MVEDFHAWKSTLANKNIDWITLVCVMADWQAYQFPETTAKSAAKHLSYEAYELLDGKDLDLEEWADAFHLVIQGGVKAAGGIQPFRLAIASKLKHNIFEREWQKPDTDGVVEHVRPTTFYDEGNPR